MSEHVVYNIDLDISEAVGELRQLEALTSRLLGTTERLLRKYGADENIVDAINRLHGMLRLIQIVHITYSALMTATGPWGWAMLAVGAVASAVTFAEVAAEVGSP